MLVTDGALYEICRRILDIEQTSYTDLNRMLRLAFSSLTAFLRFDGVQRRPVRGSSRPLVEPNINQRLVRVSP